MLGKILATIFVIVAIVCSVLIWVLPNANYHYVGLEPVTLQQAKQLQVDHNTGQNNIQVTAYDEKSDKIYVSYNFRGEETDYLKYGIAQGDYNNQYGFKISVTFVTCIMCGLWVVLFWKFFD